MILSVNARTPVEQPGADGVATPDAATGALSGPALFDISPERLWGMSDEDILRAASITPLPGETPLECARRILRAAGIPDDFPLATDVLDETTPRRSRRKSRP